MKTSTIVGILIAVGSVALLALVACGGLVFFSVRSVMTEVPELSANVDRLFEAIDNEQQAEVYADLTTAEFRAAISEEGFTQLGESIRSRLGKLQSKTSTGFHMNTVNGVQRANTTYQGTFARGKGTITATFRKQAGEWKFEAFRVDSPAFLEALVTKTCAHCGGQHPPDAKFCPECGKAVAIEKGE